MTTGAETLAFAGDRLRLLSQPIIDLRTGAVAREELFARVASAGGAILHPLAIRGDGDDTRLLEEVDSRTVECAAAVAARGRAVHVNLSPASLRDLGFVERAVTAVRRYRSEPGLITFELRERAFTDDVRSARRAVTTLSACRFRFAFDGFSLGSPPLHHLNDFPLSFVKIDPELVGAARSSEEAARFAVALVALSREQGMRTIAMGVEDQDTLMLARSLEVDYAQGFHIGRPRPLEAIT